MNCKCYFYDLTNNKCDGLKEYITFTFVESRAKCLKGAFVTYSNDVWQWRQISLLQTVQWIRILQQHSHYCTTQLFVNVPQSEMTYAFASFEWYSALHGERKLFIIEHALLSFYEWKQDFGSLFWLLHEKKKKRKADCSWSL